MKTTHLDIPQPMPSPPQILHQSPHYIVLNKHYDLLINSNDPNDVSENPPPRHHATAALFIFIIIIVSLFYSSLNYLLRYDQRCKFLSNCCMSPYHTHPLITPAHLAIALNHLSTPEATLVLVFMVLCQLELEKIMSL